MARVLDQSVDEAAALSWASKGLPRERRFREGVLRASAAGRRALVALGWPAIHDRDWPGADGEVALVRALGPRRFPVGWKPAAQLTLTGRTATDASVHVQAQEIAQSHLAVWRSRTGGNDEKEVILWL